LQKTGKLLVYITSKALESAINRWAGGRTCNR